MIARHTVNIQMARLVLGTFTGRGIGSPTSKSSAHWFSELQASRQQCKRFRFEALTRVYQELGAKLTSYV